jgi:hypothetical protein
MDFPLALPMRCREHGKRWERCPGVAYDPLGAAANSRLRSASPPTGRKRADLTRDAVLNTLREIVSATAPGSELVVQFLVPAATLNQREGKFLAAHAARAAGVGEPWLSFFEPGDLVACMRQIGFREIFHFGPEQATERYLLARTDGLRLPPYFGLIKARVV